MSLIRQDMLKIGFLFLRDGVWEGERILSSEWIEQSVQRYTTFDWGGGYGYQWWIDAPARIGELDVRMPSARGWGGQYILLISEVDIVAVSTRRIFLAVADAGDNRELHREGHD